MTTVNTAVVAGTELPATRRLTGVLRSRRLTVGLGILGFFVLLGVFGPLFVHGASTFSGLKYSPPSGAHPLGTTQTGQDVFAQLVISTRASLAIGAAAGALATIISVAIGITGGYVGGWLDEALSLVSNVVLVIPTLPLVIVVSAFLKTSGVLSVVLIIALTSWAASARVLRAQTLSVRSRDYVLATKSSGERGWRIVFVEILPNELPIIVSQLIFAMVFAILTQASLAFLGLGDVNLMTWGNMLYRANNDEALQGGAWWYFVPPGLCIALVGMGLALVNFGLDEVLNPKLRVYRPTKRARS
ncbi:MAG TPA: ABC transporter permease [Pseudonocardiaceae bacterium]|jgi:peptide/nickel transport system permease protein|nr:ABC transporter permease [Pseudonocardiaceae bacterium]